MPLVKLDIPAGVYSHGVDLDSKGRWLDSSLVRWTNNAPQPVGGWVEFANIETINNDPQLEDAADWTLSLGSSHDSTENTLNITVDGGTISQGSLSLLADTEYSIDISVLSVTSNVIGVSVDLGGTTAGTITPASVAQSALHSFDVTLGASPTSSFELTLSAFADGSPPLAVFTSIVIRQKDRVSRGSHAWVTNAGAPYIAAGSYNRLAASDGNGVVYDITPSGLSTGIAEASENLGYGGKNYGAGSYGTPRERDYSIAPATNWTLDNWGQNLVACSDAAGLVYEWVFDPATGTPEAQAKAITTANGYTENAPTGVDALVVTAERFLFCLGTGDSTRQVKWSDRENLGVWTPSFTNEAGDIELQTSGKIVAGARVRGRTLICTDIDAWVATYQGPPTVYGFQKIGNSCGLVGRNMLASVGPTAFWMGERNFFVYDGSTARVLPCEVHDKVFTEMNHDRLSHGFCVANQKFNEVWWFYPGDAQDENTRYVAYDYNENHWLVGDLARSTGVDSGVFVDPMWLGIDGTIYRHESGYGHESSPVFLESGPINFDDGDNVVRITEMIPEEETQGEVAMTFKTRFYPNGTETSHGPYDPANPTSVRMTGRQFRVRIDGDAETNWRVGDIRLRVSGGGRR